MLSVCLVTAFLGKYFLYLYGFNFFVCVCGDVMLFLFGLKLVSARITEVLHRIFMK